MERQLRKIRQLSISQILIAVNVAIFLVATFLGTFQNFNIVLIWLGAESAQYIVTGQIWRLLTYAFLHANFIHLALNMYFLWNLGPFVERYFGKDKFIITYILTAISAGVFSFIWQVVEIQRGTQFIMISVGASGAIFGLLGLILGHTLKNRRYGSRLPINMNQLLFVVGINLFLGFTIPGIDNAGHIGGLVGGMILALVMDQEIFVKIAYPLVVSVVVVAFVAQAITML